MDPLTLALIGGGIGLAKSEFFDRPQAERDRNVAAETTRWSPWTRMQAQPVQEANALGSMSQGALTAAALGQGLSKEGATEKQLNAANAGAAAAPAAVTGGFAPDTNPRFGPVGGVEGQSGFIGPPQTLMMRPGSPWLGT